MFETYGLGAEGGGGGVIIGRGAEAAFRGATATGGGGKVFFSFLRSIVPLSIRYIKLLNKINKLYELERECSRAIQEVYGTLTG
jgi:hypothetical protein